MIVNDRPNDKLINHTAQYIDDMMPLRQTCSYCSASLTITDRSELKVHTFYVGYQYKEWKACFVCPVCGNTVPLTKLTEMERQYIAQYLVAKHDLVKSAVLIIFTLIIFGAAMWEIV